MSGRFVRASKFRHVHGTPAKKDKAFQNVRTECTGEGNYIAASTAFWAVATPGGGGPVIVHPHNKPGRLDANQPKLNVHKAKVVDLDFSPFMETLLATASEDAQIKVTNIPADGLKESISESAASLEGHQKKISMIKWHPTASNIIGSIAFDNVLKVWDVEKQKEVISNDEHPDFIQAFGWNEDGSLMVTTCKDKFVRIFDPRAKGTAIKGQGFDGPKGSRAEWLGSLGKIVNIGFNKASTRQYAVYDPKKFDTPLITTDIDTGAGMLIPYYDADNSVLYMAGKGDAAIRYWEVVAEEPYVHYLADFRDNESTKGACFLPKSMCDTKTCEVAICYRVMRDWISPVSFQVPRKSDLFQADIYPDTYAGTPALSADEWVAGSNKPAPKKPMKPNADGGAAAGGGGGAAAAKAPASFQAAAKPSGRDAKTVEKELEAARAKVAALEAELAKLR